MAMLVSRRLATAILVLAASSAAAGRPDLLAAQSYLERTPHLDGGWTGLEGMLYMDDWALFRKTGAGSDVLLATPVYRVQFAIPRRLQVGGTLAANAKPDGKDVLEVFARAGRADLGEHQWGYAVTAGYSRPAGSLDAELASWKSIGALRLLAAARGYSNLDGRGARAAILGGTAIPVAAGRLPLALAGDLGIVLGDGARTKPLWSVGLHAGLASTPFTVAFQASNARDPGFQGAVVDAGRIHFGVAVMSPIPVGGVLGWFAPRDRAERSVHGDIAAAPGPIRIAVSNFAFWPQRLEIATGTVVEWVNHDATRHQVSAVDGSFDAGRLGQGESWRARFDEAGVFLYHCRQHPYMQAVVVVR